MDGLSSSAAADADRLAADRLAADRLLEVDRLVDALPTFEVANFAGGGGSLTGSLSPNASESRFLSISFGLTVSFRLLMFSEMPVWPRPSAL